MRQISQSPHGIETHSCAVTSSLLMPITIQHFSFHQVLITAGRTEEAWNKKVCLTPLHITCRGNELESVCPNHSSTHTVVFIWHNNLQCISRTDSCKIKDLRQTNCFRPNLSYHKFCNEIPGARLSCNIDMQHKGQI